MKHVDEDRDGPWTLMEVCGGQTHPIIKYGVDGLVPPAIDDDPGRDLGAAGWPGDRFFFSPEEVEQT